MSRRSFPRIAPEDLRDHADDGRIARVWERVEQDLPGVDLTPRRPSGLAYLAIAAAFAAFGGGLFVGKVAFTREAVTTATPVPVEKSSSDVFAAGTQQREILLPGGAKLTLSPGAVVEKDNAAGSDAVRLKLLQGEVWLESSGAGPAPLAVAAGEARLNSQGGSAFRVSHRGENMDVDVTSGSVTLTTPAGGSEELKKNEHREMVPLHKVVASIPINAEQPRLPIPPIKPSKAMASKAKPPGMPEWLHKYTLQDYDAAFGLLSKQGIQQTIASARSASDLLAISNILRNGDRDPAGAQRALGRLVEDFPGDQRASVAAKTLVGLYEKSGQTARAKEFSEKANSLARREDSLACSRAWDRIRADRDNNGEAARAVKEYLDLYPDGECKGDFTHLGEEAPAPSDAAHPPAPAPAPIK